jgi:hypothetical protein
MRSNAGMANRIRKRSKGSRRRKMKEIEKRR